MSLKTKNLFCETSVDLVNNEINFNWRIRNFCNFKNVEKMGLRSATFGAFEREWYLRLECVSQHKYSCAKSRCRRHALLRLVCLDDLDDTGSNRADLEYGMVVLNGEGDKVELCRLDHVAQQSCKGLKGLIFDCDQELLESSGEIVVVCKITRTEPSVETKLVKEPPEDLWLPALDRLVLSDEASNPIGKGSARSKRAARC